MPYIEEICVAGNVVEVSKYYSFRYHSKGEKRNQKENDTSDAQKRINQRNAETTLRRLMNANFVDGDYLVRLDFFKRPAGSREMQRLICQKEDRSESQLVKIMIKKYLEDYEDQNGSINIQKTLNMGDNHGTINM